MDTRIPPGDEISGKTPHREMRGFAGREKQPQSEALGTSNQQAAS